MSALRGQERQSVCPLDVRIACLSPRIPGLLFCLSFWLSPGYCLLVCPSFSLLAAWSICWSVAQLVARVTLPVFRPPSPACSPSPDSGALSVCLRLSHPRLFHLSISAFPSVCSRPSPLPLTALGQKHSSFQRLPRSHPIQKRHHGQLSCLHCGPGLQALEGDQPGLMESSRNAVPTGPTTAP